MTDSAPAAAPRLPLPAAGATLVRARNLAGARAAGGEVDVTFALLIALVVLAVAGPWSMVTLVLDLALGRDGEEDM